MRYRWSISIKVLPTKNNRVRGECQSTIVTMDYGLELGREGREETGVGSTVRWEGQWIRGPSGVEGWMDPDT